MYSYTLFYSLNPLFPGANELDQVAKIHDVLGTPDQGVLQKFKQQVLLIIRDSDWNLTPEADSTYTVFVLTGCTVNNCFFLHVDQIESYAFQLPPQKRNWYFSTYPQLSSSSSVAALSDAGV